MIIQERMINYTELILLGLFAVVTFVHYKGLLDMKMYFSGIIFFVICFYISLLWRENVGDEREEHIKSKTDRIMFLLFNGILSIYIFVGLILHYDINLPLLFLGIMTFCKIIISKILNQKY